MATAPVPNFNSNNNNNTACFRSIHPSNARQGIPPISQAKRYYHNFVSGATALSLAFALTHPLDTFKTRIQASTETNARRVAMKALFNREMLRILCQGFFTSVTGAGLQGGLRLATYELSKSNILDSNTSSAVTSPVFASATSAIVGDLASSIVKIPREVITARLQTEKKLSGHASVGAVKLVRSILREDGLPGMFRGFWSTTARDIPFMVLLFTTYENFKGYHGRIGTHEYTLPAYFTTLAGGVSGAFAGYMTTPMDVVKTRIMTAQNVSGPHNPTIRNIVHLLTEEARTLSIASSPRSSMSTALYQTFMKGASQRTCWWFFVTSIFFPVYENLKDTFSRRHTNSSVASDTYI